MDGTHHENLRELLFSYIGKDIQLSIWFFSGVLSMIIQSLYFIPIYLLITNVFLLPLFYVKPLLYMTVENCLYNWLLYIVGFWPFAAGHRIVEYGDDVYQLKDENNRILVLANHQSSADVPLMMQSFTARNSRALLWILNSYFKYTPFGVVALTHGDCLINNKGYTNGGILTHVTDPIHRFKDTIVLFPEGAFRWKRMESSNKYAIKNNYPLLNHVTYPRMGAYSELMEPLVGITHVVDLTIVYESLQNPPSIGNVMDSRKSKALFNYRIYEVTKTPDIRSEGWLTQIWQQKERLLDQYYTDRNGLLQSLGTPFNVVTLSWLKVFGIHLFYLTFWVFSYLCFKLIKAYLLSSF